MQRRILFLSLLGLMLASSAGCSSSENPECKTDADCPAGRCQNSTCQPASAECTTDQDCAAQDLKFCSQAGKCEWACLADTDCGAGESCVGHVCGDVCSTCKANEYCHNGQKCLPTPTPCEDAAGCGTSEVCINLGNSGACLMQCDPRKNTAAGTNRTCWDSFGTCLGYSDTNPGAGLCLPPATNSREVGQSCLDWNSFESPAYNDCKEGGICSEELDGSGSCWKVCDPKQNADAKTPGANPGCAKDHYCVPFKDGRGACDSRPTNRLRNETCEGNDPATPDYGQCVGSNDVCTGFVTLKLCLQSCVAFSSGGCEAGYSCTPLDVWSDAGACVKTVEKTRKAGERCLVKDDPRAPEWNDCDRAVCVNNVCTASREANRVAGERCEVGTDSTKPEYNSCVSGLTCFQKVCYTSCTPADTSPCTATELCWEYDQFDKKGVCQTKCDTAHGVTAGTECAEGFYCNPDLTNKPGLCKALPAVTQGTVLAGQECSNYTSTKFCDGSKDLFCNASSLKCAKACDPRAGIKGNAACMQGEDCFENKDSFKGGICAPAGNRALGESCSTDAAKNQVCENGLFCTGTKDSKKCVQSCNPANNAAGGNPSCQAGELCGAGGPLAGGYCSAPVTRYTDCSGGLSCEAGTICTGTGSGHYCLEICDPNAKPSACPAGFDCVPVQSGNSGACAQKCTAIEQCTLYGTLCKSLGGSTNYCL